jgi:bacterioferritin-associated ferredoxin
VIVCVCRAVCERHLRAVIAQGAMTAAEVEAACGAGGDCGTCRPDVERLIEQAAPQPLVALAGRRQAA